MEIVELIAEGDRVVARLMLMGTHTGPFAGRDASGRFARWSSIRIYQVADHQVVQTWAMVRFARLIHRRVRAFWPAYGAACGGSLSLPWWLLRVVPYPTRPRIARCALSRRPKLLPSPLQLARPLNRGRRVDDRLEQPATYSLQSGSP
jgi:hypothetical protein